MLKIQMIIELLCILLLVGITNPVSGAAQTGKALELMQQSLALLERGEYRSAARGFEQMRTACSDDEFCTAEALFYLGRCRVETGRYDEAMELFYQAEPIYDKLGKHKDLAVLCEMKARVCEGKGEYDQAVKYHGDAERLLRGLSQPDEKELGLVLANRAITQVRLCNYASAEKDLLGARDLMRTAAPEMLVQLDGVEALMLTQRQEYQKASALYTKLLQHYITANNAAGTAIMLNNLGHIQESRALYAQAEDNYRKALEIAARIGDSLTEGESLNHLGSVNWKRGNFPAARAFYEKALTIREKLEQRKLYADTLNNLGLVDLAYGDYRTALKRFSESRDICRKTGARDGEAWALHNLSFVLKDQGDFTGALQFEGMAVKLAGAVKNRRLKATALLRRGNLCEYFGEFEDALRDYASAAKTQCEIGDLLFLSNTLVDMANIYVRKQKLDITKDEISNIFNNPCIHGMIDEKINEPDNENHNEIFAAKLYNNALELKRRINAPLVEILCKYAIFLIEKPQYGHETDRAQDLRRSAELVKEAQSRIAAADKHDRLLLTYTAARCLMEKDADKPAEALKKFSDLLALAQSAGSLKYSFLAQVWTGLACERLNELAKAEEAFTAAVDYAERIRDTLDPEARLTFLRGEEIFGVKHVLPYEGLARVRMKRGDNKGSLEASEQTKARSFSDSLSRSLAVTSSNIDHSLVENLADVEKQIRRNAQELERCRVEQGTRSRLPVLEDERKSLMEKRTHTLDQIRVQDEGTFMAISGGWRPLEGIALGKGEWAVSYEVTDSATLIYLIKGGRVVQAHSRGVSRERIDTLISRLRQAFDYPPDPISFDMDAVHAGKELFDILLGPIMDTLPPGERVIIVPDDSLGIVPFEMLAMSESGHMMPGRLFPRVLDVSFLGERNPLSYCQSLTALSLSRERARKGKAPGTRFLIMADPIIRCRRDTGEEELSRERMERLELELSPLHDAALTPGASGPMGLLSPGACSDVESMPRLDGTGRLAARLEKEFSGTEVYTRESASLATFLDAVAGRMDGFGKVLFATHAILGGQFTGLREPALLLSNVPAGTDSWLRMRNIAGLKMNADVVVLLACQTGLGKIISGEGTMGMGRAFQLAGARSVLMSLWMVEESASVRLAGAFFKHLSEGRSKIEALRMAREELRKAKEGTYDHPFFWAGFILAGEM